MEGNLQVRVKFKPGLFVLCARVQYPEGKGYFLEAYTFEASSVEEFKEKESAFRTGYEANGFGIEESLIVPIDPELIQDLETERVEEETE